MSIFPKKSIKGKAMPKVNRKKKTFSYMDMNFKRQSMSYSPKQLFKDVKTVIKRKKNLKSAAKSEARSYFKSKRMTPTPASLKMKEQGIYRKLKNK